MTVHPKAVPSLAVLAAAAALLSACAQTSPNADLNLNAPTALDQYPLKAQTMVKSINLRIEPDGLSPNQRAALDQVASQASWIAGQPVNVEIVTAGDPVAMTAGHGVGDYLSAHAVSDDDISLRSTQDQPSDVVTVNLVLYRAKVYDCNRAWENLAATASNKVDQNFGCAISSDLAAQVADPRDLGGPAPATSTDAPRKSVILGKYRTGDVTSSAKDDSAKGTISDAIK